MTSTQSSVKRRTTLDTVFEMGKHRRVVIAIGLNQKDPDLVQFKLEGMQGWTDGVSIKSLWWEAFRRTANRKWAEENKRREIEGRRKLRKPRYLKQPI